MAEASYTSLSANPIRGDIAAGEIHSVRYVWYVIFLLYLTHLISYVDRTALSVLAPVIQADLQLSDTQLGLLGGFAFSVFYAICAIPIARWADRGNRRNIIAIALATWSAMTAFTSFAQNFWHLFAARMGVGAGEAGGHWPAQSMLCDYVPLHRRPGAFAFMSFGIYSGMMFGMTFTGVLGEALGWRWTFVMLGIPGVVLALIVRLTLREPVRGAFDAKRSASSPMSLSETLGFVMRCRTFRTLLVFLVLNGCVQIGLTQWWPSFYVRLHGMSISSVGIYLGVAIGVGSGIGLLTGGLLANKLGQRNIRLPLIISAIATILALPTGLAVLFVAAPSVSIFFAFLTAVLWSVYSGSVQAALASVVMPHMRATSGAIWGFLSALGMGMGPFAVGFLSDILSSSLGTDSLRYALVLPVCLFPAMALVIVVASKTLSDDLRAVGALT